MTITSAQYDAICEIVDRAKNDNVSRDTDAYALEILAVTGSTVEDDHAAESDVSVYGAGCV